MSDPTPAEMQVLGAVMLDPTVLDTAGLRHEDFYRPAHADLWALLTRMHSRGEPTTPDAVMLTLGSDPIRGLGPAELHAIYASCTSPATAGYYARHVREAADLRAVHAAGVSLAHAATDGSSADDAKAHARKVLDSLDARDSTTVTLGDVLEDVLTEAEEGPRTGSVRTPWPEVDDALAGLRPGALYTIGARPGVGKSVVAASLAWHAALCGRPGLVFSLEMSRRDLTRRLVSQVAEVDYGRMLRGTLTDLEWQRIARATGVLAETRFVMDDRTGITASEIAATARSVARKGLGVVVVDYLQLMTPTDRRVPREQQVSECSRAMKVLAGDLDVPVVMLSQLNRAVEARHDKRPLLSDLRESGSVEQDSDVVMLLYRDEEKSPDFLDVGVAKNRFGPTTAVRLRWEGRYQRVVSPSLAVVA